MVLHRAAFAGQSSAVRGAAGLAPGNTRIIVQSTSRQSVARQSGSAVSIGRTLAILTGWNRTMALAGSRHAAQSPQETMAPPDRSWTPNAHSERLPRVAHCGGQAPTSP